MVRLHVEWGLLMQMQNFKRLPHVILRRCELRVARQGAWRMRGLGKGQKLRDMAESGA